VRVPPDVSSISAPSRSFGEIVALARKRLGMSQKELAARIVKDDGTPISPQYLNDLEHDRRNAPSEHLLRQFASVLSVPMEYLCFVAGQLPEDLRREAHPPERVEAAFQAFRRTLRGG
jgi:transcriptional regulator with XRE-family HTH domain